MRLFLRLLLIATLAFAAGAVLLVRENPEADFWAELRERQDQELAAIRESHPGKPVILFTGGSSCVFSVDPGIVSEETGAPAINLGTSAWAGPKYYIHETFKRALPGDLMVLGIEPNFLTRPGLLEPTPLGLALAWGTGEPDAAVGDDSFGDSLSLRQQVDLLRPGARYLVTWAAKRIAGGERYYYSMADYQGGGRLETRRGHPSGTGDAEIQPGQLTPEARVFLEEVMKLAGRRGVDVVYALPWYFTAPQSVESNRLARAELLGEIATILPVLPDPDLGIRTEPELFSDTHFHLTAAGSEMRSRFLGRGLKAMTE